MFWCPLVGAESDSCGEKWPMGGSHFPPGQGTFPKIGVQLWGKVAAAGYTPPFFRTWQGESGHRPISCVAVK